MASILIAEDAPAINSLMAANLRLVGHNCDQAYTGEQALAFSAKKTYDLVLLDVMLPGVDGFAVKAKLPPDQPVIFVTAQGRAGRQAARPWPGRRGLHRQAL